MRSLLKLILVLSILGGLAFGGAKLGMQHQAEAEVEHLVIKFANEVDINYGEITTQLDGTTTVSEILIQPVDSETELRIDEIKLVAPLEYYLFESKDFDDQDFVPPEKLFLSLTGLHIPLQDDMLQQFSTFASPGEQQLITGPGGCDERGQLNAAAMRALGFGELLVDFNAGMYFTEFDNGFNADVSLYVRDLQSVNLELKLVDLPRESMRAGNMNMQTLPSLSGALASIFVAPEYGKSMTKYCGEAAGISAEEYRENMLNHWLDDMEMTGFIPGSGLRFALKLFSEDWGEMRLQARPAEPVGMISMMAMAPERLKEVLDLYLAVNKHMVTDLSYEFDVSRMGQQFAVQRQKSVEKEQEPETRPTRRNSYRYEYREIDLADLDKYRRYKIRLTLKNNPTREGFLISYVNQLAKIEKRLKTGKIVAHVPKRDIERAELLVKIPLSSDSASQQDEQQ